MSGGQLQLASDTKEWRLYTVEEISPGETGWKHGGWEVGMVTVAGFGSGEICPIYGQRREDRSSPGFKFSCANAAAKLGDFSLFSEDHESSEGIDDNPNVWGRDDVRLL